MHHAAIFATAKASDVMILRCRRSAGMALLLVLAASVAAGAASYTPPISNRATILLSGSWRFLRADSPGSEVPAFDDSTWSSVTVPHTWNAVDGQDGPDVGGDPNGRSYYRGIGRYRRHFSVPGDFE